MKDDIPYKISAVRIFTTDFHRSKDFYVNIVGFDVEAYGGWKGLLASFLTGETKFVLEQFYPNEAEAQELVGRFVGLSFAVSDIAETYRKLQGKGVEFTHPTRGSFGEVSWFIFEIRTAIFWPCFKSQMISR